MVSQCSAHPIHTKGIPQPIRTRQPTGTKIAAQRKPPEPIRRHHGGQEVVIHHQKWPRKWGRVHERSTQRPVCGVVGVVRGLPSEMWTVKGLLGTCWPAKVRGGDSVNREIQRLLGRVGHGTGAGQLRIHFFLRQHRPDPASTVPPGTLLASARRSLGSMLRQRDVTFSIYRNPEFSIWTREAGAGGLSIAVEGPSKAEITFEDRKDGSCGVAYVVQEPGDYEVSIKFNDENIPDSPFVVPVATLADGARALSVTSLQPLKYTCATTPQPLKYTRVLTPQPLKYPRAMTPQPFKYNMFYDTRALKIPLSSDTTALKASLNYDLTALKEMGLKVGQEASFSVQLNGARGSVDAKVHTPSGAIEECHVTELDSDQYAIRFIPRENGVHSIDVRFNGSHVPGSPFNVRVGDPGQAGDPGMVSAFGPGLEGGSTGAASEFFVSTCNAGSGALSLTIDGPSKVKMDCVECPEGYRVTYTPMAPGSYLISIRYGGPRHIVGSPFKAKVSGACLSGGHSLHETSSVLVETVTKSSQAAAAAVGGGGFPSLPKFSSDASKAVSRGAGLSKAFVGQKNMFTVDCSNAGTNMLMVGVHGPKTPCEEVYVKHMGNRMYNVTYTVKEQGDYILIVKWGDDNVPGSPFHVTVP
ncbi:unnamed protein product [Arctogadus glacialis]